jgi:hypothetical protein
MMNDASSISVLGNGRASDLPKVPGRAIWKNGIEMLEVQTPFLSSEQAELLIGPVTEKVKTESAASSSAEIASVIISDPTAQSDIPSAGGKILKFPDKSGIETN